MFRKMFWGEIIVSFCLMALAGLYTKVAVAGSVSSVSAEVIDVSDAAAEITIDSVRQRIIVADAGNGILSLYDINNGKEVLQREYTDTENFYSPISICFDPKGDRIFLLGGAPEEAIFIYDAKNLKFLRRIDRINGHKISNAGSMYVDNKKNRLILNNGNETDFIDLFTLDYISSLKYKVSAEFDPYSSKSEIYSIAFDEDMRALFLAKSLNSHLNLSKDEWAGYEDCLISLNVDTGDLLNTVGKCHSGDAQNANPNMVFSFIRSGAVNLLNQKLILGELSPEKDVHLRVFNLRTMKEEGALNKYLPSESEPGRPISMASDSDDVLVLFRHQVYSEILVFNIGKEL